MCYDKRSDAPRAEARTQPAEPVVEPVTVPEAAPEPAPVARDEQPVAVSA